MSERLIDAEGARLIRRAALGCSGERMVVEYFRRNGVPEPERWQEWAACVGDHAADVLASLMLYFERCALDWAAVEAHARARVVKLAGSRTAAAPPSPPPVLLGPGGEFRRAWPGP